MRSKTKVTIIGAGFVGAASAFAMALNETVSEMAIVDVNKEKALGEAMDINHGISFIGQMNVYAGDYSDCKDSDVIIITAGSARKPGETRLDLAKKNVSIAKGITENIMKHYTRGVILVVSNPVDILTYQIQKWSGLPTGRVMGTGTVLDSSRFRYALSKKLNVDVRNVHGYIIGEHGDTMLPAWSNSHIAGRELSEYFNTPGSGLTEKDKEIIEEEIQKAGAEIIKNKGATYYAIAITVNTIVETLLKDQNTIRTVSSVINGFHGINDVALSLPSIVNANGVLKIVDMNLSPEEEARLMLSASKIREMLKEINA